MTLLQVPAVREHFTLPDFIKSLIISWYNIYQNYPTKPQIGVILAQFGIETALTAVSPVGTAKDCWNFNIGNVKAADDPNATIKYCALTGVWEIINGNRVVLDSSNPGSWFRAFDSLQEGTDFHLNFLKNNRYKNAWTAVENGNPTEFATLLKSEHYYTAPLQDYINGMMSVYNHYIASSMFEDTLSQINNDANNTAINNIGSDINNVANS